MLPQEKKFDDASKVFFEYVRIGRGHNGGLVAASRDICAIMDVLIFMAEVMRLLPDHPLKREALRRYETLINNAGH